MDNLDWNTPPTEEEMKMAETPTGWDTPPTEAEMGKIEAPTEVDTSMMDFGTTSDIGIYTPPIAEEGGMTASPEELEFEQNRAVMADVQGIQADLENISMTTGDKLGLTEDSQVQRKQAQDRLGIVLKQKYGLEKRDITMDDGSTKTVLVDLDNPTKQYPYEPSMFKDILASKFKEIGAVGGAVAGGIAGATLSPPTPQTKALGTALGGTIGAISGAIAGDYADTTMQAIEHDIKISTEERLDRVFEISIEELAAVTGAEAISKVASKLFNSVAESGFKSLADMPKKYRQAIQTLQDKSGIDDKAMEKVIKDYSKSTEAGTLTLDDAVRGAAQSSHKEQLGVLIDAIDDPVAKTNLLKEIDTRSKGIGKALADNEELLSLYSKNTITDKGRSATNWRGLYDDMMGAGVSPDDPLVRNIGENANVFDNYEARVFRTVVQPERDMGVAGVEKLIGVKETARGGAKQQGFGLWIESINKRLNEWFPSDETKVARIIKDSLVDGRVKPKELSDNLTAGGIDTNKARALVEQVEKAQIKEDNQLAKQLMIEETEEAKQTIKATKLQEAEDIKLQKLADTQIADIEKKVTKVHGMDAKSQSDFITRMGKEAKKAKKKKDRTPTLELGLHKERKLSDAQEAMRRNKENMTDEDVTAQANQTIFKKWKKEGGVDAKYRNLDDAGLKAEEDRLAANVDYTKPKGKPSIMSEEFIESSSDKGVSAKFRARAETGKMSYWKDEVVTASRGKKTYGEVYDALQVEGYTKEESENIVGHLYDAKTKKQFNYILKNLGVEELRI